MKSPQRLLSRALRLLPALLVAAPVASRQASAADDGSRAVYRGVTRAVRSDVSPPLRAITPPEYRARVHREIPERRTGLEGALGRQEVDPLLQGEAGPGLIPGPIVSFNGLT